MTTDLADWGFQIREPYHEWRPFGDALVSAFQHDTDRWTIERLDQDQFWCVQRHVRTDRAMEIVRDPRTVSLRNGELWWEPVAVRVADRWVTLHDGHHRLLAHWMQHEACPPFRILSVTLADVASVPCALPTEVYHGV